MKSTLKSPTNIPTSIQQSGIPLWRKIYIKVAFDRWNHNQFKISLLTDIKWIVMHLRSDLIEMASILYYCIQFAIGRSNHEKWIKSNHPEKGNEIYKWIKYNSIWFQYSFSTHIKWIVINQKVGQEMELRTCFIKALKLLFTRWIRYPQIDV